jgi:ketosteroid isomerase-like protein
MRSAVRSIAACAVVLGACNRSRDIAPSRAALMEADRAFNSATTARRMDGWIEYFAEEGAMIRSAGTVTGRAAIRDVMAKTFADTSFTLTWEPDQADASGDLAYTNGHFTARFRDAKGQAQVRTGRYLTVWKRQPDGSWKVVRDIGVQDPPTAPQ